MRIKTILQYKSSKHIFVRIPAGTNGAYLLLAVLDNTVGKNTIFIGNKIKLLSAIAQFWL